MSAVLPREASAIAIVGAGRLGTALGILFARAGYEVRSVMCRSAARAQAAAERIGAGEPHTDVARAVKRANVVLIATPDAAVAEVAGQVAAAKRLRRDDLLVHTSGALPADAMRVKGAERAQLLSLHPVQTIADPVSGAERLRGCTYGLEGDQSALAWGEQAVRDLGGVPVRIKPGAKALYHAAACMGSNYLVTLIDASVRLYEMAGLSREEALAALKPLVQGTLENVDRLGVVWALTGPIERGDVDTVRTHLQALAADENLEGMYRMLGLHTLALAKAKAGAGSAAHQGMHELLSGVYAGP